MDVDAKLAEVKEDKLAFFHDCLVVRDHNTARIVPFELNRGQAILHRIAEKQKKERGYIRVLLLKSRRFGGSTYVEGRTYHNTSMNFNRNAFIVGHEEESTKTLFMMSKLFHERNPFAPSILASNAQELRFDNKAGTGLKSEYRLATAKNAAAGRSQGIHYLHISEEAFWPSGAEESLLSLFQCVPDPPAESEIFRESTANGYGNTFQEDVFKAYSEGRYPYYQENGIIYAWSSPKSDWVLVFIPWFIQERYRKPFDSKAQRDDFEAEINKKVFDKDNMQWIEHPAMSLKKRYNLSLDQLYWRQWCIENKCGGSVDKFNQEYPATVLEAFLSKGSNVFSKELCDSIEAECLEPLIVGDVVKLAGKTRVKRNKYGALSVWEKCKNEDSYFMTVDCAGGQKKLSEAEKKAQKEPDKTNIDVWNHRTGVQACQWNGHIPYDLIGDMVMMIGEMYGIDYGNRVDLPMACVELNNHGFTVVADLKRASYPQYEMKPGEPGWQTNRRTKPQMVDSLYRASRDGELKINSKETVNEMRTYIEINGEFGAAGGSNDDRVITAAIAAEIGKVLPRKYLELRTKKRASGAGFKNWDMRENNSKTESTYQEYYV